jgi:hypothetical protein
MQALHLTSSPPRTFPGALRGPHRDDDGASPHAAAPCVTSARVEDSGRPPSQSGRLRKLRRLSGRSRALLARHPPAPRTRPHRPLRLPPRRPAEERASRRLPCATPARLWAACSQTSSAYRPTWRLPAYAARALRQVTAQLPSRCLQSVGFDPLLAPPALAGRRQPHHEPIAAAPTERSSSKVPAVWRGARWLVLPRPLS